MTPDSPLVCTSTRPAPRGSGRSRSRTIAGIEVRRWFPTHAVAVDLVTATTVAGLALVVEAVGPPGTDSSVGAGDVAVSVIAFVLVMVRRRAPLPVLGVTLVAAVVSMAPADDHVVLELVACLALYSVASTSSRRVAVLAGVVTGTVLFVTATLTTSVSWYDGDNLEELAWAAIATAIGVAVRSRRDELVAREERATALLERAERAEAALEEEARRQVVEERIRIARELHDVVAHHIAVINVQAGVASHLLRQDPDGAEAALAHVRRGVSGVLDEIGGILSVLRRPDDATSSTDPLPTLDQLDQLVAGAGAAGLEVEWLTSGARREVSPAVALAAYRIVQESLTNAHRHGRADRACLRVDYTPRTLAIEVVNDADATVPTDPGAARRGHGIVGMRERAAAAGGTIDLGPTTDGQFRVHATFPLVEADR